MKTLLDDPRETTVSEPRLVGTTDEWQKDQVAQETRLRDQYNRRLALRRSCELAPHQSFGADDVVVTARKFYDFLQGR